ncbi:MAG: methylmalonyl-CoA mutase family protein [Bacteroidota bacterium]
MFRSSSADWERLVESELKKPGAAESLTWHTNEGFDILPYQQEYLNADVEVLSRNIREMMTRPAGTEFYNYQMLRGTDGKALSTTIGNALEGGVNGLLFTNEPDAANLDIALEGVMTEYLWISFLSPKPVSLVTAFSGRLKKLGIDPSRQLGSISVSPFQYLAEHGAWAAGQSDEMIALKHHVDLLDRELPSMKAICINASIVANAGGTLSQQIAFALAQGNEYLNWASEAGLDVARLASKMEFHFSFGTNFLPECVKTRSFKWLWSRVLSQYSISGVECFVSTCTSTIGSSIYDSNNNLLRYTTASMAAIISGSDAHTVLPYDSEYAENTAFSDRIARNINNLLLEESFLGKVDNVTAGSYAFDNIQYQLCEQAWKFFLDIESHGGFIKAVESGKWKTEIEKSAAELKEQYNSGKLVILGVNKFPNKGETKKGEWKPISDQSPASALAITPFRLAEVTENERLNQEA